MQRVKSGEKRDWRMVLSVREGRGLWSSTDGEWERSRGKNLGITSQVIIVLALEAGTPAFLHHLKEKGGRRNHSAIVITPMEYTRTYLALVPGNFKVMDDDTFTENLTLHDFGISFVRVALLFSRWVFPA